MLLLSCGCCFGTWDVCGRGERVGLDCDVALDSDSGDISSQCSSYAGEPLEAITAGAQSGQSDGTWALTARLAHVAPLLLLADSGQREPCVYDAEGADWRWASSRRGSSQP